MPQSPNKTPRSTNLITSIGDNPKWAEIGCINFSRPNACDVQAATREAIMAGYKAVSCKFPTTKTSIANKTAASGVWNSPAKPAAIPVTKNTFEVLGVEKFLQNQWETVAPNCTATPSRPAEPPKRCVNQVVTITRGIKRLGMWFSTPWPTSKIKVIPLLLFPPYFW